MQELMKALAFCAVGGVIWVAISAFEAEATGKPLLDCIIYPACGQGRIR